MESHADIDLVTSYIRQLPFLETVEFAEVGMLSLPADMSIAPLRKHEPLEPLNTNLRKLTLRFEGRSKARDTAAVVQYLLMRLPNLTMFCVWDVSVQPVLDFARKYSRFYPHLKNAESVFRNQLHY
ncbi:hypothetical protein H4R21_003384 [Coemansia helicoidea]|uniref:Uncharacterized protein n=1 Tax=Coemansia helicoidea TaxID=1286919 RepID=A0ACC1L2E7_9FUNG|nr:hypothetical protein H4R21_003384 [Coemansia helicoidea]